MFDSILAGATQTDIINAPNAQITAEVGQSICVVALTDGVITGAETKFPKNAGAVTFNISKGAQVMHLKSVTLTVGVYQVFYLPL